MKKLFLLLLLFTSRISYAQEDIIVMKTGQKIKCEILSKNDSVFQIEINGNILDFTKKGIEFYRMKRIWYNSDGSINFSISDMDYTSGEVIEKNIKLQDQVDYMRKNLRQSHYFFTTGLILDACGTGICLLSLHSIYSNSLFMGVLVSSIGTIFMVTSHHFIGRAGIGIGGKGVKVNYTF